VCERKYKKKSSIKLKKRIETHKNLLNKKYSQKKGEKKK
jgi:hypothetical protein